MSAIQFSESPNRRIVDSVLAYFYVSSATDEVPRSHRVRAQLLGSKPMPLQRESLRRLLTW